jgi:predicted dehydrogenase
MNFALLGDDPSARSLLEAALAGGHIMQRAALADRRLPMIKNLFGRNANPIYLDRWEDLLTDSNIEAVIVAGDSEEIQTAAKQLAMSGKPLLIVPKAEFGWACGYELSLIRDDSHVVLMPAFLHRGNVELLALSQRLAARELGNVRRMQIDVEIPAEPQRSSRRAGTPRDEPLSPRTARQTIWSSIKQNTACQVNSPVEEVAVR